MDAFFASVEQLDDPALRGKPVLVGGSGPRGVVAAASYEARVFGCHSAMPTAIARRRCPHAIIVRGSFARYRELSSQIMAVLESFSPLVQPISIDEAFVDVSGSTRLLGAPSDIARAIRARIKADTGLTASVGVAPNKFLAKLASDLDKPDGLVVINPDQIQQILEPLPVSRIFGIGPAAEKRLHAIGARTIGDLARLPESVLQARLGSFGPRVAQLARGIDDRPVHSDRTAKSISHEQTFAHDLESPDDARRVLAQQVEAVARRLRSRTRLAMGVALKLRFGDFQTVSRSTTLPTPTSATDDLWHACETIFTAWRARDGYRPLRLIGMAAAPLTDADTHQLDLFAEPTRTRQTALDAAADEIARRFGTDALKRGRSL